MDTGGREYLRRRMPKIGLGTFQIRSEKVIYDIIDAALETGYRFIDTAQIYGNEAAIGRSLNELLPKYNLTRQDIFITTKISPANQGEKAAKSIETSLEHLQTDYIDLVIIHWPGVNKLKSADARNKDMRKQTWATLEQFYKRGILKAIGVSNYEVKHLKSLLEHATVLPALNQVEYHPHFHQNDLVEFCKRHDIHFQAYSSLGGPDYREQLFQDETVNRLADKYKITVPIFLLSWALAQNMSVLPRSSKPDRVRENFTALKVKLDEDDVSKLLNNRIMHKACWNPEVVE